MKHSNSLNHLKKFVYVDSSEEQQQQLQKEVENVHQLGRECNQDGNQLWSEDGYRREMKKLIQEQIDKIEGGNIMLVAADDKEVQENFRMRQQKFQYFKEQMEIDEKYTRIIEDKASKLREQNKRKQQVLSRKRREEQLHDQECMLQKYIIEKKGKQELVVDRVKKTVHKLAVQRKVHTAKHVRTQIQTQKEMTQQQLHDLKVRQKNQLQQLRQKYEVIKIEKRVNKLDQEKVLRDLERQNHQQKKQLKQQLLVKKTFEV